MVAVVEENATLTLNMTARGNPAAITYSWYRGAAKLTLGTRFRQDAGVLTVTPGLSRAEAGVYTCEASSSEGSTTHDINIDVHCKENDQNGPKPKRPTRVSKTAHVASPKRPLLRRFG